MLGLRYASPKYWFLGAEVSYYDHTYIDFAPGKRTAEALQGLEPGDPRRDALTRQEKMPSAMLIDANIGKSWRYKSYFINLNFQVTNILDKTDFKTGGFEQARYSITEQTSDKFLPSISMVWSYILPDFRSQILKRINLVKMRKVAFILTILTAGALIYRLLDVWISHTMRLNPGWIQQRLLPILPLLSKGHVPW